METMLGFGWLALRQAQEALQSGRLEEAQRLLAEPAARGHKRGNELILQLARAFAQRGDSHRGRGDQPAAWNDLLKAEQTGVAETGVQDLRNALTEHGLTEVRRLLDVGEATRAVEAAGQLRERGVRLTGLDPLEEGAKEWVRARDLADRGEFAQAMQALERVRRLLPRNGVLEADCRQVKEREQAFPTVLVKLHGAARERRWQDVLGITEQVLALAPNHGEARKLRGQAWKSIEPVTEVNPPARIEGLPAPARPADQYLLWIDGVGGFLVCLGNKVTFGQATPEARVDIPIFADVSRHHATLTRDTEGYLLEGVRAVQVNGKDADRALLHSGDRVTLGTACQFQFRQPVPLSASAVLELVSGHRLRLAVNAIVLMADTIVLGQGPQVHVLMPDLRQPVILYRHKDGLGIRCSGDALIGGKPCKDRGVIEPGAAVAGEDFSLGLELVGGAP
jgi:tetratricopeptide (TPR) repeat protein